MAKDRNDQLSVSFWILSFLDILWWRHNTTSGLRVAIYFYWLRCWFYPRQRWNTRTMLPDTLLFPYRKLNPQILHDEPYMMTTSYLTRPVFIQISQLTCIVVTISKPKRYRNISSKNAIPTGFGFPSTMHLKVNGSPSNTSTSRGGLWINSGLWPWVKPESNFCVENKRPSSLLSVLEVDVSRSSSA